MKPIALVLKFFIVFAICWNASVCHCSNQIIVCEKLTPILSKNFCDNPAVYCSRVIAKRELFNALIKIIFIIKFLFFSFKRILTDFFFQRNFKLFLILIYYFILDLDIHILSSRAHPPTFDISY